jgi:Fic family protein
LSVFELQKLDLKLHKMNSIRSVQGSLAIEGNTLNEEQISAILGGKKVIAPPSKILEVKKCY